MKNIRATAMLLCLFALLCPRAAAQGVATGAKHFSDKGLSFDYPPDLSLDDQSKEGGQVLVLKQEKKSAQIIVFSRFDSINSPEEFEAARRAVADAYADSMFEEMKKEAQVERTNVETRIAGAQAKGTRLRATLNGVPGNLEVYWVLLGKRLVVVTLMGPDEEIAELADAWAMFRSSLRVAPAAASKLNALPDAARLSRAAAPFSLAAARPAV
ncbi:MAG TPA: hypothetical protein VFA21_12975 [Pyrinomonadaceae bacterium]|nr:hypothetical protein [Pyrinomonadaceae bacterium]